MKILMTLMGLNIGGAETHVVELSKELQKQGHSVIVASNGGVYEQALSHAGIRHVKVPMNQRNVVKMIQSLGLLRTLIREEKPDLVHAHARIPAFLCGILHKQMGFPFITSAHGVFQVTPILRIMTNWGQRTVSVSEDIRSYLMHNYQVPENHIHMTINGIDTGHFAPCPPNPELIKALGIGSGPVIGTVSRLDSPQELAAKELIGLMPRLREEFPNAQLLVVGGGDQEEVLCQQAEQINRQLRTNAVIMTGPRTDIAQLVSLANVFVGVSRAALEAMAAEKPTILAGGQGYIGTLVPEVLELAQKTNFCCRGCEQISREKMLSDLLGLLTCTDDERLELGRFGRRVVLEQYSVARMTRDYLDAYERLLSPVRPIRAVISGYYGYGNLGDDAILLAISQQLRGMEPPVELNVLSRHPKDTTGQYGLRAVHRFSPFKVYRALKDSDLLISGGGSLLQDKTSTRSLLYYLTVIRLAKRLGKPVFVYANGIGPVNKEVNRKKVRQCIDSCDVITLRDADSLTQLRQLGVTRDDIIVTGDPAFTLNAAQDKYRDLASFGVPEGSSVIGVSVRSIPELGNFPFEMAKLCDRLVQQAGKTIVFLVMQESEDEALSQQIRQMMSSPSYIAKTPGDPASMLSIISEMDALISMRLHTIIFAASVNVPVMGCVYDPKVEAFLHMLDMPSCGAPADMDGDKTYLATVELLRHGDEHRAHLASSMAQLAPLAEETVELFKKMLKKHDLIDAD